MAHLPWIKFYPEVEHHPKAHSLAYKLVEPVAKVLEAQQMPGMIPHEFMQTLAVGYLARLWFLALKYGHNGFVGDNEALIETSVGWAEGPSGALVKALVSAGWLDEVRDEAAKTKWYRVHDWAEHQEALEAVEAKRQAERDKKRQQREAGDAGHRGDKKGTA